MRILKLELKRILKTKLCWILLLLALLLSVLLAYLPTTFCYSSYKDKNGTEISLSGLASIAYEKKLQADASGTVTKERVKKAVEAYHACLNAYGVKESYDLPEGVYEQEILPIAPLLHGVKEAFANPATGMAPSLIEIQPGQIADFDDICKKRLTSLMASEQPASTAAQQQAVRMYGRVKKPFAVYPGISSTVMDYQNMLGFLILLFCVMAAAPVYSADYQSGADQILRCTKYGRRTLGTAKAAAALIISGISFAACSIVYIFTANSLFGWESTKTSIQMVYSILTLTGITIGQLQWLFAFAGLLSVCASVSLALFLSSRCKNIVLPLGAAFVSCIAPTAACMALPDGLSSWICTLLPASGTSIQASILYALTDFRFLTAGGFAVWLPYAMMGACIIEIPLFLALAVRSYCRHTASR